MMPDQPDRAKRDDIVVFTASAEAISKDVLAQLKEKYGLELRIRSSVAAIDNLVARAVDVVAYDRTHPGYDRTYDRDPNVRLSIASRVINPAPDRLRELGLGSEPDELG
jgi:hypothetical protein